MGRFSLIHFFVCSSTCPFIYILFSSSSLEYKKNLEWIMLMDKNQGVCNRVTILGWERSTGDPISEPGWSWRNNHRAFFPHLLAGWCGIARRKPAQVKGSAELGSVAIQSTSRFWLFLKLKCWGVRSKWTQTSCCKNLCLVLSAAMAYVRVGIPLLELAYRIPHFQPLKDQMNIELPPCDCCLCPHSLTESGLFPFYS